MPKNRVRRLGFDGEAEGAWSSSGSSLNRDTNWEISSTIGASSSMAAGVTGAAAGTARGAGQWLSRGQATGAARSAVRGHHRCCRPSGLRAVRAGMAQAARLGRAGVQAYPGCGSPEKVAVAANLLVSTQLSSQVIIAPLLTPAALPPSPTALPPRPTQRKEGGCRTAQSAPTIRACRGAAGAT